MKKRKPSRKRGNEILIIGVLIIGIILVAGSVLAIKRYAPSKERLALTDYFVLKAEDDAAVILNGKYNPDEKKPVAEGKVINNTPYLELSFIKTNLDNGYVYDKEEQILRYATEKDLISTQVGKLGYSKGRDNVDYSVDIVLEKDEGVYLNLNFVKEFTDFEFSYANDPYRIRIETPNTVKNITGLKGNVPLRRFGGPKSKILKDGLKGDSVWVLEDYGKWSSVLTEDGVIGCVPNGKLGKVEEVTVEKKLPERVYEHHFLPGKVNLGWHQVTGTAGNNSLEKILNSTSGLNVVSPTWYRIADNNGNIKNYSSQAYVNLCHSRGIEVWALVSNFDEQGVDSTQVLNRTSSRDNLVNSLVAAAIADNVDGINIDFEALSIDAKDGFIQFVREISLKCKANDLILSIDNYKPEAHTIFYNRAEQAKYADYVIVMAYDEHHGDSTEAGSNSSLPFVKEAVNDTLSEVPPEQLVVALPFYTRLFTTDGANVSQKALSMGEANSLSDKYNAEKIWQADKEQYYVKYEKDGKINEVWLEDEESLSRKMGLVKEKNLGGLAFWKLGLEQSSIWDVISLYVK